MRLFKDFFFSILSWVIYLFCLLYFMIAPLTAMEEDETGRTSNSPPPVMNVDQDPVSLMDKMRKAAFHSFYKQKEEERASLVKIGNTTIGSLMQLTEIYLNQQQLTALPPEIGYLTKVVTLNLYDNKLTILPSEIGSLKALKKLKLNFNQLTNLPDTFSKLTGLKKLYLWGNPFRQPPTSLISSLKKKGVEVLYE